jgi:hypothetical protein
MDSRQLRGTHRQLGVHLQVDALDVLQLPLEGADEDLGRFRGAGGCTVQCNVHSTACSAHPFYMNWHHSSINYLCAFFCS